MPDLTVCPKCLYAGDLCQCPGAGFDQAAVKTNPMVTVEARDGARALDDVAAWIGRYLSVPSEHYITVLTLWAAHTWISDVFYVTPRLIIDSAEPESGKTRVLELLNLLVRSPIFTMNTTIAALYRRLAAEPRTILLDETDAIFAKGAAQNHEDLRALLNAGYKRGATVDRCVPKGNDIVVVEFPAFAPAALAGIAGNMPDTITSRGITLTMRRRAPGEHVDEYVEEDVIEEAAKVREPMAAWTVGAAEKINGARPVMPDGVRDRKAEIWRALLAVADAAGGTWPTRAREACTAFVTGAKAHAKTSRKVRLLIDIRDIFSSMPHVGFLPSAVLLTELKKIEESPWGEFGLTARKLALDLSHFDVEPRRNSAQTARGYHLVDLADAFHRWIPQPDPSDPSKPSGSSVCAGQSTDGSPFSTRLPTRLTETDKTSDGSPDGSEQQPVYAADLRKHHDPDGLDGTDGSGADTASPDGPTTKTCIICARFLDPAYRPEWHALSMCPTCGQEAGVRADDLQPPTQVTLTNVNHSRGGETNGDG